MTTPELKARLRNAMGCLNLLLEIGADGAALDAQRERVRVLRRELNRRCPDGSLSPFEGNIVEKPV